jgi:hypothetical protein
VHVSFATFLTLRKVGIIKKYSDSAEDNKTIYAPETSLVAGRQVQDD